ncbi:hypothetical protein NDU88_000848 [Pleurodeles waltl]|uniref:Uncharacterized protein n=1 Tax=Pleurodeles waltl TaxID=8319 RepID=A0AAV7VUQ1_PLEWA|nr:hypothetical protein NDU88_000848 [Pleurodeles waltl]
MGSIEAGASSACPQQREAHEAHVTPVVASQFIQEGGTPKPPGPLRSQAVDQQDRNPMGLLVGPGIQRRSNTEKGPTMVNNSQNTKTKGRPTRSGISRLPIR